MKKHKIRYAKIAPNDMTVDSRYQRQLDERRAKANAENFHEALVGVIVVSLRVDGTHVVLDGQHRRATLLFAGLGDVPVLAEIHEGLTIEEEAELFLRLNNGRSSVRKWDQFNARVVAKEPVAVAIVVVLKSLGLKLSNQKTQYGVSAVDALDSAHHKQTLRQALTAVRDWMEGDPSALDGVFIRAAAEFFVEWPNASPDELATKLSKHTPSRVSLMIKNTIDGMHIKFPLAARLVFRNIYNERRRHGLLPMPGEKSHKA